MYLAIRPFVIGVLLFAVVGIAGFNPENAPFDASDEHRLELETAESHLLCEITFRGRHGGATDEITIDFRESQVRTRVGWWAAIARGRGEWGGDGPDPGTVTLRPGDTFERDYSLTFGCNARRRYRFHISSGGTEHTLTYPSEDEFTQQTLVDLGDVSRFFEWIEPGAGPVAGAPVEINGTSLEGEWVRIGNNYDPHNGMRIQVSADQATLTYVPETADRGAWREGDLIWQGISSEGSLDVLGSNDRYYDARLTFDASNRLDIDVLYNGVGNDQTWERSGGGGAETAEGPFETRRQALSAVRSSVWRETSIPVCWEDFRSDEADERRWSREAVEETWEAEADVDFTGWEECEDESDGVRIEVRDIGPKVDALGNELNGLEHGMHLNFTFNSWATVRCQNNREFCIRAIAVHEFGHAMAIAHEQNRTDTPLSCQTQQQGTSGDWNVTPYDLFSVMNYCNPNWGGNGQLSPSDIQGAVRLYGSAEHNKLGLYEDDDQFGGALAVGDFDGDGFDDLAIGAPGEAPGGAPRSGAVFVFRGTETGGLRPWHSLTQSSLGNNEAGDLFGYALVAADFDFDGRDDLAVGAPGEAPGNDPASGAVFLFHGTTEGLEPWELLTQTGLGNNEMFDAFGRSLAAGDFDGDYRMDLAVGAPGEKPGDGASNSGAVFLFRGAALELEPWHSITEEGLSTNETGDRFGVALAVGDFDADGKDDLAVGAHGKNVGGANNSGAVFVFRGAEERILPWTLLDQTGLGSNESGDWFGRALTAGDFNGDGTDDLAVGAPHEAPGNNPESGAVFIFIGGTSGMTPWEVLDQSGLGVNEEGDGFGTTLAAGDFDTDGADDLAVGAPGEAPGNDPASGVVFVFGGGTSGMMPLVVLDQAGLGSNEDGDALGSALAVGRFSDHAGAHLAVGAPGEAPGRQPRSGYVFVYANLDDDPTDSQSAQMRGWYGFGQQY